jgi:hypothetical protein
MLLTDYQTLGNVMDAVWYLMRGQMPITIKVV